MSDKTFLYRHFAADGSLLYVGISLSWPMRTKAHAGQSKWFEEVAELKIQQFPTREAALDAEREAIRRERPRFNIVHNRPRITSSGERKPAGQRLATGPLDYIKGPHALIGPALLYRGNTISVMVAWGAPGTAGELTEIILGELAPEAPAWAEMCASVVLVCEAGEITMPEARHMRMKIVRQLASRLSKVDAFETDLALAKAYAERFPSSKAQQILREIADEARP